MGLLRLSSVFYVSCVLYVSLGVLYVSRRSSTFLVVDLDGQDGPACHPLPVSVESEVGRVGETVSHPRLDFGSFVGKTFDFLRSKQKRVTSLEIGA